MTRTVERYFVGTPDEVVFTKYTGDIGIDIEYPYYGEAACDLNGREAALLRDFLLKYYPPEADDGD